MPDPVLNTKTNTVPASTKCTVKWGVQKASITNRPFLGQEVKSVVGARGRDRKGSEEAFQEMWDVVS